jgi:hypothetical protein
MKKDAAKSLSLKTETVRAMSTEELKDVNGGAPNSWCFTIIIPSSGLTTTIGIYLKKC